MRSTSEPVRALATWKEELRIYGSDAVAKRIDEAYREPVCAVVESMTGARLVHDTLEQEGWRTGYKA